MAKDSELNMTLKYITGIDISFVIDDIIGYYIDPNIPVNIDEYFSIDVDTPHGICNIATDYYEVNFKRFISETYYEEYKLKLNDEDFLKLEGKAIESREKGYIINNIEKKYAATDNEKNDQIDKEENLRVNSIIYISKKQRVYPEKYLYKCGKTLFKNKKLDEILTIFEKFSDYYPWFEKEVRHHMNTVTMYLPLSKSGNSITFIDVIIDNCDCSHLYPMLNGDNIVGRAFNLYEGIINQENYDDALNLIRREMFSKAFSYEDCKIYYEGTVSINEIIVYLVGNSTINHRKEYSSYVTDIVNRYYKRIKKHPFLFDANGIARHHKKYKLDKNNYIEQILLSNRDDM